MPRDTGIEINTARDPSPLVLGFIGATPSGAEALALEKTLETGYAVSRPFSWSRFLRIQGLALGLIWSWQKSRHPSDLKPLEPKDLEKDFVVIPAEVITKADKDGWDWLQLQSAFAYFQEGTAPASPPWAVMASGEKSKGPGSKAVGKGEGDEEKFEMRRRLQVLQTDDHLPERTAEVMRANLDNPAFDRGLKLLKDSTFKSDFGCSSDVEAFVLWADLQGALDDEGRFTEGSVTLAISMKGKELDKLAEKIQQGPVAGEEERRVKFLVDFGFSREKAVEMVKKSPAGAKEAYEIEAADLGILLEILKALKGE